MTTISVPFLDLHRIHEPDLRDFTSALNRQVRRSEFVLGDAVLGFERDFSAFTGLGDIISTNSGTSALHLALLALGVGPGDEVIVPAMTFIASAAAVVYVGATPVFVDVDRASWNLDPELIERSISPRTKAIMVVHLHGLMADMSRICQVAEAHNLVVVEDAAQAHGASIGNRKVGTYGDATCFSFYPGKNLGALGEGGALFVREPERAARARSLRAWAAQDKYIHLEVGFNYRMESIQAAFLSIKLKNLESWTVERENIAKIYESNLGSRYLTCFVPDNHRHVRHIFSIRTHDRKIVIEKFNDWSIGWGIHYPIPLHLQPAFASLGYERGSLPVAEALGEEFLSLPMFPGMTEDEIDYVLDCLAS